MASKFKVRGILLDVEGTTSAVSYVYDVMFPYARKHLADFLTRHWQDKEVRNACELVAVDAGARTFADWIGTDKYPSYEQAGAKLVAELERLMDGDIKATGLKAIQGLIWRDGYEAGELQSHVFDDVPSAMKSWEAAGIDVRIYSSGSVQAQKVFFANTKYGDLTPYIHGNYDTTTGAKRDAASYEKIAADMNMEPKDVLFLSDVAEELQAASKAKMQTGLVIRPGNAPAKAAKKTAVIHSFKDISAISMAEPKANLAELFPWFVEQNTGATAAMTNPQVSAGEAISLQLPTWLSIEELPAVTMDGAILTPAQAKAIISCLQESKLDQPHPFIEALREHTGRRTFDRFSWAVCEQWINMNMPAKERAGLTAVGLLGGDFCAVKITPFIKAWPGALRHKMALEGLQCLRMIGTNIALLQMASIAGQQTVNALKEEAEKHLAAMADVLNISRAELEDRIVPDCDLDSNGSRTFDYGPEQFTFVLSGELRPMIKDSSGKIRSDLPKGKAKDDPAKVAQAQDEWKVLKQQIKEVGKLQARRLEQAMVTGKRWPLRNFEDLIVAHPLMTNFAKRLVWVGYDGDGNQMMTFRVTPENTYTSSADRDVAMNGVVEVGLIHPAKLSKAEKERWGELLSDYEIMSPFQQLTRSVIYLDPHEAEGTLITRFATRPIPSIVLIGALQRNGWTKGAYNNEGLFTEHIKYFRNSDVTAVLYYKEGLYPMQDFDVPVDACFFVRGEAEPEFERDFDEALPLLQVDAVTISEVLRLVSALSYKAQEQV